MNLVIIGLLFAIMMLLGFAIDKLCHIHDALDAIRKASGEDKP